MRYRGSLRLEAVAVWLKGGTVTAKTLFRRKSPTKIQMVFHLCPRCFRSVPSATREMYCPNDGSPMLVACPQCQHPITLPHARFCSACGYEYRQYLKQG